MRILFSIILAVHGLIHIMGFAKAFGFYDFKEISAEISKPLGILWFLVTLIFIITLILYITRTQYWWALAIAGAILSQVLVILFWKDAKFGTIANLIILAVAVVGYQSWSFEKSYLHDVIQGIQRNQSNNIEILKNEDIQHLPLPVQNYLEYTGSVDKPKVFNFKVSFSAEMRGRDQDWFNLDTEQYNFMDDLERLFFLKAKFKGLPTQGYHLYKDGRSGMNIKLLSTIPVVNVSGEEMFQSETVTMLNDMCFLAPPTLIDERIKWEEIDNLNAKAIFTNQNTTVSAILYFNEEGQLINFESLDRYDVNEMKKYKFSTPIKDYREINGYRLAHYGKAVWHYPEGDFAYGKYQLKDVEYNVLEYPEK
ncbi:MAG: DUF6544 family protein [Bacteroidales bacterium]